MKGKYTSVKVIVNLKKSTTVKLDAPKSKKIHTGHIRFFDSSGIEWYFS
jgi:hypothetical protein